MRHHSWLFLILAVADDLANYLFSSPEKPEGGKDDFFALPVNSCFWNSFCGLPDSIYFEYDLNNIYIIWKENNLSQTSQRMQRKKSQRSLRTLRFKYNIRGRKNERKIIKKISSPSC